MVWIYPVAGGILFLILVLLAAQKGRKTLLGFGGIFVLCFFLAIFLFFMNPFAAIVSPIFLLILLSLFKERKKKDKEKKKK